MKTIFSIGNPGGLQQYLVQLQPESRVMEFNGAALKGNFLVFTRDGTKVFGQVLFADKENAGELIVEMEFAFYEATLHDIADAMSILLRDVETNRIQGQSCIVRAKHDGKNHDFVRIMHGKGFHSPTDVLLVKQFKKKPSS